MAINNDLLNPASHARAVLRMRDEAQNFLEEARTNGNHKETRSWASQLKKVDKMITGYGLERYLHSNKNS